MLEVAQVLVRLAQYAGAAILFGSSLFLLYGLPRAGPASPASLRWPQILLNSGALVTVSAAALGLLTQTSVMAGSWAEGLKPESLAFVITGTGIGQAGVFRVVAGAAALAILLTLRPGSLVWGLVSAVGAASCASLAWMGHGAATEGLGGRVHLVADILHSLAAAAWTGALVAFVLLCWPRSAASAEHQRSLHGALHGFAGVGAALVGVIVATGAVNSWFLIGPDRLDGLWTTAYGRLLLAKLGLFAVMLVVAASNRFRLTPALAHSLDGGASTPHAALTALRRSLILETTAAGAILVLVAWLGTLAPVSAA